MGTQTPQKWGTDLNKWLIVKSRTGDGKWWVFRPCCWREKVVPTFADALAAAVSLPIETPTEEKQK